MAEDLLELEVAELSHSYVLVRDAGTRTDLFAEVTHRAQIPPDFKLQLLKQRKLDPVLKQRCLRPFDDDGAFGRLALLKIEMLVANEPQIDEFLLIGSHFCSGLLAFLYPEAVLG